MFEHLRTQETLSGHFRKSRKKGLVGSARGQRDCKPPPDPCFLGQIRNFRDRQPHALLQRKLFVPPPRAPMVVRIALLQSIRRNELSFRERGCCHGFLCEFFLWILLGAFCPLKRRTENPQRNPQQNSRQTPCSEKRHRKIHSAGRGPDPSWAPRRQASSHSTRPIFASLAERMEKVTRTNFFSGDCKGEQGCIPKGLF